MVARKVKAQNWSLCGGGAGALGVKSIRFWAKFCSNGADFSFGGVMLGFLYGFGHPELASACC